MTRIPTTAVLTDDLAKLRRPADDWKHLEQTLATFATRLRRGGPSHRIDGFPASTMGGGGGGGATIAVDADAHGPAERVPVTSVEAAAIALAEGREKRDLVAQHFTEAMRHLENARLAIGGLFRMKELLDLLDDAPVTRKRCEACMAAGIERLPDHWGSVGSRLDRNADLCDAHYDYVLKFGQLPTEDQTRQHERTGRWRTRVVA